MARIVSVLPILALCCAAARAAALVPVPSSPQPLLPAPGLEANQGQAGAGILFLSRTTTSSIAVTAQSVSYSPMGATLALVSSNPNPTVSYSDPLPGFVNAYAGADPAKWATGIPRYSKATLAAIYPGIDAQYTVDPSGILTLNLTLAPGANLNAVQFSTPQAESVSAFPNGSLFANFYPGGGVRLLILNVAASQTGPSGQTSPSANFTVLQGTNFGLSVQGIDSTLPLQIAIQLNGGLGVGYQDSIVPLQRATDPVGNTYYVTAVADAAGKTPPFPAISGTGCGNEIDYPILCTDVAISKYSATGTLEFITYLEGGVNEAPGFAGFTPDGKLAVAGTTDSADFPATAGALQITYAGPPAAPAESSTPVGGDYFAAILDPSTGRLQSATFFGGPNADTLGTAAIGGDGSFYFLPASLTGTSAGMPVSSGALMAACQGDPCLNGYAARLSPDLDKLIYGTYLPGTSQATAQLYSDGSVYYAGTAEAGFPVTPGAYQRQNAGGYDGIVARLDATGSKLVFATYFGGPETDWILSIALSPDGSVWANVISFLQCCHSGPLQLIHLDGSGSRLLADVPVYGDAMVVDAAGNLVALAEGSIAVSPGAILGGSCGGPAYVRLSPTGQQLFATYLPGGSEVSFDGVDAQGDPYVDLPTGRVQVVENQPAPASVGCVVDAASFLQYGNPPEISPGGIVTLFGSGMGPSEGLGAQLTNGQLTTSLGGTEVMVNGEPAPLLYASYGQVNLILPYDLPVGTTATIQVVTNGTTLNELANLQVVAAHISVFQLNGAAVALNQDYSVNSARNPAQPGSTVMLFGTGGGQTSPPSVAGGVTPLELRPLVITPQAAIIDLYPMQPPALFLKVEFAGAAPELLSGVTQINVTLPATIPLAPGYPPGTLPLQVVEPGMTTDQVVTIFAAAPPTPTPASGVAR